MIHSCHQEPRRCSGAGLTLLIVALVMSPLLASCNKTGRGTLSVEREAIDVGEVTQGEVVRAVLRIGNHGQSPVTFKPALNNCSCTDVSVGTDSVKAGEYAAADINIATETIPTGPFTQRVQIDTSDPGQPVVVVNVSGIVLAEFAPDVTQVDLGDTTSNSRVSSTIRVAITRNPELVVTGVTSTDPRLAVSLQTVQTSTGKVVEVTVTQLPGAARGLYTGTIILSTSSKFMPRLYVPVRGRVS